MAVQILTEDQRYKLDREPDLLAQAQQGEEVYDSQDQAHPECDHPDDLVALRGFLVCLAKRRIALQECLRGGGAITGDTSPSFVACLGGGGCVDDTF